MNSGLLGGEFFQLAKASGRGVRHGLGACTGRHQLPSVGLVVGFGRACARGARASGAVVLAFERHAKAFLGFARVGLCRRGGQAKGGTQGQNQGGFAGRAGHRSGVGA